MNATPRLKPSITTGVMWVQTASIRTTYATIDSIPAPIASHGKLPPESTGGRGRVGTGGRGRVGTG